MSQMIRPMTTRTPSAIKAHPRGEIVPVAVGELVGEGVGDAGSAVGDGEGDGDGDGDGGAVVTCGVGGAVVGAAGCDVGMLGGETVMPWLATALLMAPAALLTAPHPATPNVTARIPAARINKPFRRRMDIALSSGRRAARSSLAGGDFGRIVPRAKDAPETEVAGGAVHRLALPGGGPVAQAVVRRAQV
jgi:hypothetical protein